jgi:hypothetical protein
VTHPTWAEIPSPLVRQRTVRQVDSVCVHRFRVLAIGDIAMSAVRSVVRRGTLLLAIASAGCAGGPKALRSAPIVDQQLITQDVIRGSNYTNMYDVVLALRSTWIRTRPFDSVYSTSVVQVYLDAQRVGGPDELKSLAPGSVESVRYFDPIAASARWGMNHGAGVLYVVTAKR